MPISRKSRMTQTMGVMPCPLMTGDGCHRHERTETRPIAIAPLFFEKWGTNLFKTAFAQGEKRAAATHCKPHNRKRTKSRGFCGNDGGFSVDKRCGLCYNIPKEIFKYDTERSARWTFGWRGVHFPCVLLCVLLSRQGFFCAVPQPNERTKYLCKKQVPT